MSNAQHFPMQGTAPQTKLAHGSFVGAATAAPTTVDGEVVSVARSGVGVLVATLRNTYTKGLMPKVVCVGPTLLRANITAWDPTATPPTLSFTLVAGASTATDATTSDTVYIEVSARNGGG